MRVARVLAIGLGILIVAGAPMAYAQAEPPGVVVLKGAPNGDVKFDHKAHTAAAAKKCDTCHHASKPEKPSKVAQENCTNCHTRVATAPMKTKLQAAFHNPMATVGTCVDCHLKQAAAGKTVPAKSKCTDCHKKA